ncbi:MAG TPA: flagellar filament capping protein FliD [Bryobacteraceae bacterium]|nr:flagellar filament capping protein FliD [Bryobacteraceae bacterium]
MSTSSASNLSSNLSLFAPQTSTTGTSTFSTTLQDSVTRALEIAALPMQQLQNDQSTISNQTSELGTLSNLFGSLQTALQAISSGTGSSALTASASDSTVLSTNITGNALPGTYTVDVLNAGSTSSAESNSSTPVTDPTSQSISSSSTFTLTVGTSTYTITPAGNDLNDLAAAINSSGAAAQATVINIGTPESPNYQLSLQSTALGAVNLQLYDGTNNLLTSTGTGTTGSYTVNGQPSGGITTDSSTVTIAPGLTANLLAAGTSTITVSSSLSSVSSELASFVNAYNAAYAEVEKNTGTSGGALVGDSTILAMQQGLNQMMSYIGSSGAVTSIAQLGVEYTQQGTLTFDSSAISDLTSTQINDALTFLGNTNGGGFLANANNVLNSITDPTSGVIATETQTLQTQNQNDQTQINNDETQLTLLQTNLQNQMAQANALIASLQSQNNFLQGLFQADTSNNPNAATAG